MKKIKGMNSRAVFLALAAWSVVAWPLRADELTVDFPASPRFPVFASGDPVGMTFRVRREDASKRGKVLWEVVDHLGETVRKGEDEVAAGETMQEISVFLKDLPAGYFALHAQLAAPGNGFGEKASRVELPRRGSRPPGMASFGVLSELKALPLASATDSRFGVQGTNFIQSGIFKQGNPYDPLYMALGARWVNVGRSWAEAEPEHSGQFAVSLQNRKPAEADYIPAGNLAPLYCVFNLPWWAIDFPADFKVDRKDGALRQAFPPHDPSQYADYLETMAKDIAVSRGIPRQKRVYQVGWEPDWHWKGSDEQFVAMYRAAYRGIHRGDPDALVLGPGYGVTEKGAELLERLLPKGLAGALDGIAIHGYYVPFGNPKEVSVGGRYVSPEEGNAAGSIRKVRALMDRYLAPGAKLFQTEWGLDYRGRYRDVTPELLRRQAAYIIRGHLIFLGEGCDVTYFFYTADYGDLEKRGEDGYGLCFNLTMPKPSFGATHVSPKPVFMAASTLTRVLEGTATRGPVDLGEGLCGYLFHRDGEEVLAFWSRDNVSRRVKIPVGEGRMRRVDFMGNLFEVSGAEGSVEVMASEYPNYLIGVSPARLKRVAVAP